MRWCSVVRGLPMTFCPNCSASNCATQRLTALTNLHIFADLANTQALDFDHLSNLEFEARVKELFKDFCLFTTTAV